ncbi:MAG: hypothetical protein MH825_02825 [Cyanobacteria bacterium]|nr:hypothetical protein [Cyanobacteriota bacterium]
MPVRRLRPLVHRLIGRWSQRLTPPPLQGRSRFLAQSFAVGLMVAVVTLGMVLGLPMAPARACQQVEQFSGATAPVSTAHRQLLSGATLDDRLLPAIAARLGTDVTRMQVIDTRAIVWSDGCLGVTSPDQFCTQALVGGIAITVAYGGKSHQFHASDDLLWPVASLTGHTDRVCRLAAPSAIASGNG